MQHLQRALERRFPSWFNGPRAPLSRALWSGYSRFAMLPALDAFLQRNAHLRGLALVDAALEWLDCRYLVDHVERERIPQQGRVVIVSNHPLGGLDALVLLACVGQVRRDVRIVANDVLTPLHGLQDLLLPVPTFGGDASTGRLRAIARALHDDAAVIVFPAAEVSRLGWRGVRDAPWQDGFVRLAQRAQAPLLPVRIDGRNSALFYGASMLFKPFGTGLLPRELQRRRGARLVVRVGDARAVAEASSGDPHHTAATLRRTVYQLGTRRDSWRARHAAVAHRRCPRQLRRELEALPLLGETPDGKRIHAGRLATDSALLHEIARLRESTFRLVGEGTGKRTDTDAFDSWYDHIVLWDAHEGEIAGAYRAVPGRRALRERGPDGLYCASLFRLDARLAPMIEDGVELGRSFVAPRYWGTRSLDYLWLGIGAWLRHQAGVRYLFGPVSISAALPRAARDWIVGYYSRYFGAAEPLASPMLPFSYAGHAPPDFGALDAAAAMVVLCRNLDALGARVPVLYKQYVELCEPGGASFLAFGTDPAFSDSVDGLIRVDLARVKAARRRRYLDAR
jgi:putative hemolysin